MEATRSRHGWVHMFITHCPTVALRLHNFDLFRTCRTSSICTVGWHLARFQLTRRISRSIGDSWASCLVLFSSMSNNAGLSSGPYRAPLTLSARFWFDEDLCRRLYWTHAVITHPTRPDQPSGKRRRSHCPYVASQNIVDGRPEHCRIKSTACRRQSRNCMTGPPVCLLRSDDGIKTGACCDREKWRSHRNWGGSKNANLRL